jgi:hypothetical protein
VGGRRVRAADGRTWTVKRRWAPRLGGDSLWGRFRRRIKGVIHHGKAVADVGDAGCILDLFDEIVIVLVLVGVVLLVVFVAVPLLFALLDLALVLLLTVGGVVGRVVFRRPWTIEARADDGTVHTWKVVGWRAADARREEIALSLAAGIVPVETLVP